MSPPLVTAAWIEVGGVIIAAGELVVPGLLAMNRDRSRSPEPERLDRDRAPLGHVAFGHGVQAQPGEPFEQRAQGDPPFEPRQGSAEAVVLAVSTKDLIRSPGLLMKGLTALPVALGRLR